MRTISAEKAKEELRKRARQMGMNDINGVISNSKVLYDKAQSGALGGFIRDIKTLGSLVLDFKRGNYTAVPWPTIATAGATLAYIISPIDLIPDVLPFVGLLDDAAVLRVCLSAIQVDLDDYKKWQAHKKSSNTAA